MFITERPRVASTARMEVVLKQGEVFGCTHQLLKQEEGPTLG